MNLHEVLNAGPVYKKRKRVGFGIGSGHGKTSCRGSKGHGARESFHGKLGHEGGQMPLFRRVPKRGFTNGPFRVDYLAINVGDLARVFKAGEEVTMAALRERGVINSPRSKLKVLGGGEIGFALKVTAQAFSASAETKIKAAGGSVERSS